MKQDEIIDKDEVLKMAKQAGFAEGMIISTTGEVLVWDASPKQLEAFAKLVAEKERERISQKIAQLPFGDTAQSLSIWVKNDT